MNKTFILALFLFWMVELLCIALLFIYNLLQIFVAIRNHKYLNNVFAEKKLNWFSEDGKYLSMSNQELAHKIISPKPTVKLQYTSRNKVLNN